MKIKLPISVPEMDILYDRGHLSELAQMFTESQMDIAENFVS